MKLAQALLRLASREQIPPRWPAGADAVVAIEQRAQRLLKDAKANRELSSHLDHD